jgi:hypothetical protein
MIVKDEYRYRLIAVLRVKTDIITSISASDNVCKTTYYVLHIVAYDQNWGVVRHFIIQLIFFLK